MSDNIVKVNVAELIADRDKLHRILWDNGFRRCDVPACNCDSWHPHGGFYARFREIDEAVGDHNGKTLLRAVEEMRDELADLRAYKERTEAGLVDLSGAVTLNNRTPDDGSHHAFLLNTITWKMRRNGLWRDPPQAEVQP